MEALPQKITGLPGLLDRLALIPSTRAQIWQVSPVPIHRNLEVELHRKSLDPIDPLSSRCKLVGI